MSILDGLLPERSIRGWVLIQNFAPRNPRMHGRTGFCATSPAVQKGFDAAYVTVKLWESPQQSRGFTHD